MKLFGRLMVVMVLAALVGVVGAQGPVGDGAAKRDGVAGGGADRRASGAARFVVCDVVVESGGVGLGAWQLECVGSVRGDAKGRVELVGVEGGEAGVYEKPAFYDPEALSHERVVIGAFSTEKAEKLPRGKTRVARLHLRVVGGEAADAGGAGAGGARAQNVEMRVKVMAAGDAAGKTIEATATAVIQEAP